MKTHQQKPRFKLAILVVLVATSLGCQNGVFKLEPLTDGSGTTATSAELQEPVSYTHLTLPTNREV